VFLNYRESVERVNSYLVEQGFTTSCFHGGLEQRQREDQLYRFSNGSANVLVATDLASRGLDIPNIQNIIHYHLPESQEGYIHRVGRTARWDATGRSFFILNASEHIPDYVEGDIENYEPTANSQEPTPNSQEPTANSQEPTAKETVIKTVHTLNAEDERLKQLIDIALLASGQLKGESLAKFVNRSVELL
jgi:superfamily II DNA/RNA helicase